MLQDGQSPTGRYAVDRSLHSLEYAALEYGFACRRLRRRCVSLRLGCFFRINTAIEISFHVFFNFYRTVIIYESMNPCILLLF